MLEYKLYNIVYQARNFEEARNIFNHVITKFDNQKFPSLNILGNFTIIDYIPDNYYHFKF